jgi:MFS family permease
MRFVTCCLCPTTDTIYLPGLAELKTDFATNEQMAALSVSLYLMSVGISALVWGNLSDKFGRRPTYLVAAVAFIATSIGCIFTRSLNGFIICRMLQGLTGELTALHPHPHLPFLRTFHSSTHSAIFQPPAMPTAPTTGSS